MKNEESPKKSKPRPELPLKKEKPKTKSLGPVHNLEEHVKPNWWEGLFNSLYLKTDGDVVEDQNLTRKEIDLFLDILKPAKNHAILDLCCGQGRHVLELARRGYTRVEGIDFSHFLIRRANINAKKESHKVKFRHGDARKLPFPTDSFDVILILGNSFGYFESSQDDLKVLKEVFRVLKPWGKLLVDITDGEHVKNHFQPRSWEWIDKDCFVCRERSLSTDGNRLISREVIMHLEEGLLADQFYAERLYQEEGLFRLLQAAGFSDIGSHGSIVTESARNQDLGMMERRIIATGTVKKEWTPVKAKVKKDKKNVVVLFGDPSKPDPLKPLYVFDDDDFYTIDQLKGALKHITKYNFSYLDSHDNFIEELDKRKEKIDFVFNLCDEGYYNDPIKELHVPALLEIYRIPYTGANPQCLAYCYDKSLVRGIAKEMGIPVPSAVFINPEEMTFDLPFGYPVIVKPNFGDSSFGITQKSVAYTNEELLDALNSSKESIGKGKPILVEEFLTGKDLSLGIVGNPMLGNYTIYPIIEEDYSDLPEDLPQICGYEAKWDPTSPYSKVVSKKAKLSEETQRSIEEWSLMLFERLNCRDYARFDWRLDAKGIPKLLEVNPNPGWCWDGHLARMAEHDGYNYTQMLEAILTSAEQRIELTKAQSKTV